MAFTTEGITQDGWSKVMNPVHSLLGIGKHFMRKAAGYVSLDRDARVLDVGCGTGTFLIALYRKCLKDTSVKGSVEFVGIDPAERLLGEAKRAAQSDKCIIDFKPGVIETIPFPSDYFDVITCTFTLHHLPFHLKRSGLNEIRRVLKPAGQIFIIDIGKPVNAYEKFVSRINSGVEHFGSNIHGEIPLLLEETGFERVHIFRHQTSLFLGGIDFLRASKAMH